MKKYIMLLIALVAMATTAKAQKVYIATGKGAVAYHSNRDCGYLRHCNEVKTVTVADAKGIGRHECPSCYKTSAAKKPAAKKETTEKKPAAKKETTEKKPAAKKETTEKKPAAKPLRKRLQRRRLRQRRQKLRRLTPRKPILKRLTPRRPQPRKKLRRQHKTFISMMAKERSPRWWAPLFR